MGKPKQRLGPDTTQPLQQWLRGHGVSARKTTEVLHKSGCRDTDGLALYLRFQLPPLEYAQPESIDQHMHKLFGVGSRRGRKMVRELNVQGARLFACACPCEARSCRSSRALVVVCLR